MFTIDLVNIYWKRLFSSFLYSWLNHVRANIPSEACLNISWPAYYASNSLENVEGTENSSVILPLFKEEAHSPAMIKHSINVVSKAVKHVNPQQVPVLAGRIRRG